MVYQTKKNQELQMEQFMDHIHTLTLMAVWLPTHMLLMLQDSGTYLYQLDWSKTGNIFQNLISFCSYFSIRLNLFLDHLFQQAMERKRKRQLELAQSIAIIKLMQNLPQQPMNIKAMKNQPHQSMSLKYSAKQSLLMQLFMPMLKVLTVIITIRILIRILTCPRPSLHI